MFLFRISKIKIAKVVDFWDFYLADSYKTSTCMNHTIHLADSYKSFYDNHKNSNIKNLTDQNLEWLPTFRFISLSNNNH